jgi:hypothetical protein
MAVDRVADIVPKLQETVRGVAQAALDAPPLSHL